MDYSHVDLDSVFDGIDTENNTSSPKPQKKPVQQKVDYSGVNLDSVFDDVLGPQKETSSPASPSVQRQEQPVSRNVDYSNVDLDSVFDDVLSGGSSTERVSHDRNLLSDIGSHALRGGAKAVEQIGRGMQVVDGDYSDDEGFLDTTGKKLQEFGENAPKKFDYLKPDAAEGTDKESWFKQKAMEGVESLGPSAVPFVAAAGTGAAVAAAGASAPITALVAGGSGLAALLGTFGAGTYHEKRQEYDGVPGLTEDQKHVAALKQAGIESGGELVSDIILMGIGKLVPGAGKAVSDVAKNGIKTLLSMSPKQLAKQAGKVYLAEWGTETGQAYLQSGIDADLGVGERMTMLEAAIETAIPTAVMTLALGSATGAYNVRQKQKLFNQLNSENEEMRIAAANNVYGTLKKQDNEVAEAWRSFSSEAISNGSPIDVKADFLSNPTGEQKPDGTVSKAVDSSLKSQPGTISKAIPNQDLSAVDRMENDLASQPDNDLISSMIDGEVDIQDQADARSRKNKFADLMKNYEQFQANKTDKKTAKESAEVFQANPEQRNQEYEQKEKDLNETFRAYFAEQERQAEENKAKLQGGNITEQEAKDFEDRVNKERQQWAKKNRSKAAQRKIEKASTEVEQEEDSAEESLSSVPFEVMAQAKKEAENTVREDPRYQEMAEARKRNGINIYDAKSFFSHTTIAALNKKYPGLFQGGQLAVQGDALRVDEYAQEKGYTSADEMINNWLSAPSIKAETARIAKENVAEWERYENLQKEDEKAASATTTQEKGNTVAPGPQQTTLPEVEKITNKQSIAHGQEVATNPTDAQKEAENYKTAKVNVDGLKISVENPAGSTRSGTDPSGKEWSVKMKNDYGRILGSNGYDKDHVDIFVSPGYKGGTKYAYVVNQHNKDGSFDEHKTVVGVSSEQEALDLYNSNYKKGWTGGKSVTRLPMAAFKKWVGGTGPAKGELRRSRTVDFQQERSNDIPQSSGNTVAKTENRTPVADERSNTAIGKPAVERGSNREDRKGAQEKTLTPANIPAKEAEKEQDDQAALTPRQKQFLGFLKSDAENNRPAMIPNEKNKPVYESLVKKGHAEKEGNGYVLKKVEDTQSLGNQDIQQGVPEKGKGSKEVAETAETGEGNTSVEQERVGGDRGESVDKENLATHAGGSKTYQKGRTQVKPGELGRGIKTNKAVREYVENIKESGKVKPVEITSDGFIVDGEHRYSAMVKMGVDDIPVFVGEQLGASGRLVSPYSGISVDVVVPNETASKPVAAQKPENVSDKPKSRKAEPPPQQELPEGKEGVTDFPSLTEEGRRTDGKPIKPGDVFKTSTGRTTTPYPKYSTKRTTKPDIRRMNQWLIDNYKSEAEARGDDFNQTLAKGMDAGNFSIADAEGINLYLFRKQQTKPAVKENVPATDTNVDTKITNLKELTDFTDKLKNGTVTPEQLKQAYASAVESKEAIRAELAKKTKKQLAPLAGYMSSSDKKSAYIKSAYSNTMQGFVPSMSMSWSPFSETVEEAVQRKVNEATQEQIDQYAKEIAEVRERNKKYYESKIKGVTNPETLEEFKTFIQIKGKDKLSEEQLQSYEKLIADKNIETREQQQERKATVQGVSGDVDYELAETHHAKKDIPLYVVKLTGEKLPRERFSELRTKAKQLGGWYSRFRGSGAIPGFQFESEESRQNFVDVLSGETVKDTETVEKKQEVKTKKKVSRLRTVAERLQKAGEEKLNQDRLTNTAKRAREAGYAEASARTDIATAKTMLNLADAIDSGEAKYLNGISAKTHLDILNSLLNRAKNDADKDIPYRDQDRHREPVESDVKFVSYIYPSADKSSLYSWAGSLEKVRGGKRVASKIESIGRALKEENRYYFQNDIDLLRDVIKKIPDEFKYSTVADTLKNYDRLQRIGLTDEATLKTALREYIQFKDTGPKVDKVKELERSLVGEKNGVDFFPTPRAKAQEIVDRADIQPGMKVLEPSAGTGNLAEVMREAGAEVEVAEISPRHRELLEAKGFDIVEHDFMDMESGQYDRIVMNPPFSKNQDIEHVEKAYELLKPGGKLVSIMGEGAFFRQGKTETAFREWLDEVGYSEKLPEGFFTDRRELRTTGVNARVVEIEKPEDVSESLENDFSAGLVRKQEISLSELFQKTQTATDNPQVQKLNELLYSFVPESKLNIPVVIDPSITAAKYNAQANMITLRDPSIAPSALHETVHAVTVRELFHEKNQATRNRLARVMNKVKREVVAQGLISRKNLIAIEKAGTSKNYKSQFPEGYFSGVDHISYAFLNEKEFLAQAFSSPQFQDLLKTVKVREKGKLISAWESFVRALMKILDIKGTHETAFGEVLEIVAELAASENIAEETKGESRNEELALPDISNITAPFTGIKSRAVALAEKYMPKDRREKIATYLWDQNAAVARVQREIGEKPESQDYNLISRLSGKKIADEVKRFTEDTLDPLLQDMADNNVSFNEVHDLAWAQHAPERNLQMKRVNARRYVDEMLANMTDTQKRKYQDRLGDLQDEMVMDDKDINFKRDGYIELMDELVESVPQLIAERGDSKTALKETAKLQETAEQWTDVKDRLSGMTNQQAANKIAALKNKDNFKDIQRATNKLREINRNALEMVYQAGEYTDEEYAAMKSVYKYHVPLMREGMEEGKSATGRMGVGPLAKPYKIASGSTKGVVNIFGNVVDRYQSAISRKHKLEAGKVLFNMVKENPDENRWAITKLDQEPYLDKEGNIRFYPDHNLAPNETKVKVDGVVHIISVPRENESMMRWMEALKREPVQLGPVLKVSQKINRLLAQMNTSFSPEFLITNFARDIQTAGIHLEDTEGSGLQKEVLKGIKPAIAGIYKSETGKDAGEWGEIYKDFAKNGGKIGWMQDYETVEQLAKQLESELSYKAGEKPKRAAFRKLVKHVESLNVSVENGVRLATYKALIENGTSKRKAARTAANLTVDFTRHGTIGPFMNSLYMFANAGIIGNIRMLRALSSSRKVQKIAAGIFGFGFMANILGAYAGGDDEDGESYYDKLKRTKPSLFERNMVFMIPGTEGKIIKIPMPYGYNTLFVMGNETASAVRNVTGNVEGYSPTEGMARVGSTLMNTFNPIGSSTLLQTIMPTAGDPIAQVFENKAWHGGNLMPGDNPFGIPKPDSERYFKSVNPIAKFATRWVNDITGGSSVESGLIDVSPETIEMLFETMTGSLGRLAKDSLSLPISAATGQEITSNKIPFVRKVFEGKNEYADQQIYVENRDNVLRIKKMYEAAATPKGKRDIRSDPKTALIGYASDAEKRLRRLRKRRKIAESNDNERMQERIEKSINRIYLDFNRKYNQVSG